LPVKFWGDFVSTVTLIVNRTISQVCFQNIVLPNPIPYHSSRPATVANIEPDHEPHVIDPSPDTITY